MDKGVVTRVRLHCSRRAFSGDFNDQSLVVLSLDDAPGSGLVKAGKDWEEKCESRKDVTIFGVQLSMAAVGLLGRQC